MTDQQAGALEVGPADPEVGRWAEPPGRRARKVIGLVLVIALAAGVGFWAGSTVLESPADPLDDTAHPESYEVREGEVARSVPVVATAEWSKEPLTTAASAGVMTSIGAVGSGAVNEGDVLFSLDLRPVVAFEGEVPMFRDLGPGASGSDVEQLQAALNRLGHLGTEPDGVYRSSTQRAVRSWQRSLGVPDDGVVRAGDVVFVPAMPARIALGDEVQVGSRVSPGEQVLWRVSDAPTFRLVLPAEQASLVESGMAVDLAYGGGTWAAEVLMVATTGEGREIEAQLAGREGSPVCHEECDVLVPVGGQSTFRAMVIVTPPTAGPVVPMAAIASTADGRTVVMRSAGGEVEVEIVEVANGLAVVDGIDIGTSILVPFPATQPRAGPEP